ncbi:MAG TPA: hypothetical protein VKF35_16455 [Hyphomicrobiaceae bacterium]|nr:hypothetical protein [Hyphomicrobiaceae bacterium]
MHTLASRHCRNPRDRASRKSPGLDRRIIPDAKYPDMYRVRLPGGGLSDILNITRTKAIDVENRFYRTYSTHRGGRRTPVSFYLARIGGVDHRNEAHRWHPPQARRLEAGAHFEVRARRG